MLWHSRKSILSRLSLAESGTDINTLKERSPRARAGARGRYVVLKRIRL